MFFPVSVLAQSMSCAELWQSVSKPTCTATSLTQAQVEQNALDRTTSTGSYGFPAADTMDHINGALVNGQPVFTFDNGTVINTVGINATYQNNLTLGQNCQSTWDAYNAMVPQYNACIASQTAQEKAQSEAQASATPPAVPVPAPVIVATPPPVIAPVATITSSITVPLVAPSISVPVTPAPVLSGVPKKTVKPTLAPSAPVVTPVNIPAPQVQGTTTVQTAPVISVSIVQPVQPSQNIFVRFWSFLKSIF